MKQGCKRDLVQSHQGSLQALAKFCMSFMSSVGKACRKLCTLGEVSLLTCS